MLPVLIMPDQMGFVKKDHFTHSRKKRVLAVSLDVEKAFDRVEWESFFNVLDRFVLGLWERALP